MPGYWILSTVTEEPVPQTALRDGVAALLRVGLWGIDADERHRDALAAGDLVLVYLGAPAREFVGRAELASAVHPWTSSEASVYPGDAPSGVSLAQVEQWDRPASMSVVLSNLGPSPDAKADFDAGVVEISAHEYETVIAVTAGRAA